MYLTYEEYTSMGGTVDETAFTHLEFKANKQIDYQTFERVKYGMLNNLFNQYEISSIKNCTFELIKIDQMTVSNGENKLITGISNDGISETYRVFSNERELNYQIANTISYYLSDVYLDGVPVLYLGADELPKVVERYSNSI